MSQLEENLKALAQTLGLSERVHFLGARAPQELAKLYQDSDLFVLPSSGEALPSVVAEAMFCGTPVVATRVGGIPEQMGPYGITVPPNLAEALAEGIERVLSNYGKFTSQAEEMSNFARCRASTEVMVAKHVELYRELAAQDESLRRGVRGRRAFDYVAEKGVSLLCRMKSANWSPATHGYRRHSGDISS